MSDARIIPLDRGDRGDRRDPGDRRQSDRSDVGDHGDRRESADRADRKPRAASGPVRVRTVQTGRRTQTADAPTDPPGTDPARATEPGAEAGTEAGTEPGTGPGEDAAAGRGDVHGPGHAAEVPDWERRLAEALAFLRRRLTGDYTVDEYGFDAELTDQVLYALVRPLYEKYFRVEARGLHNVPDTGGALIVANHSGTIALDAVMTAVALLDHHPAKRYLRMLGADLVFSTPVVAPLARKAGHTLACNADAERLLTSGELVGVWPEGFKGVGKPFSERYKLQRFGRGGFVSAALRTGVPIIPVSIVGAEEIYPMIGNLKTLARLLGLPYLPVTPTFPWLGPLGLIPLPSKWIIQFGEPIHTDQLGESAADDPMLVFNITDQVRETIQQTLYRLLMQRRSVFF